MENVFVICSFQQQQQKNGFRSGEEVPFYIKYTTMEMVIVNCKMSLEISQIFNL